VALFPTYASDHLFLVDYVAKKGNLVVAQFKVRDGKPPKQGKRLLRLKLPTGDDHLGGQLNRGTAMPDEAGRYFFADLCSGHVRSLVVGSARSRTSGTSR
jgi:hypothetical protein